MPPTMATDACASLHVLVEEISRRTLMHNPRLQKLGSEHFVFSAYDNFRPFFKRPTTRSCLETWGTRIANRLRGTRL